MHKARLCRIDQKPPVVVGANGAESHAWPWGFVDGRVVKPFPYLGRADCGWREPPDCDCIARAQQLAYAIRSAVSNRTKFPFELHDPCCARAALAKANRFLAERRPLQRSGQQWVFAGVSAVNTGIRIVRNVGVHANVRSHRRCTFTGKPEHHGTDIPSHSLRMAWVLASCGAYVSNRQGSGRIARHRPGIMGLQEFRRRGHTGHAEVEPQSVAVWIENNWHPVVES
jgi:hypothetical protein